MLRTWSRLLSRIQEWSKEDLPTGLECAPRQMHTVIIHAFVKGHKVVKAKQWFVIL